ncbi:uncharacterized protein L201_006281 [Kwoniella dendrophila CBS 6074]|uniref:Pericentrin/AKAP-450 centrosomal targeting domain-containing protein n=1 Tax=Kwoniella dendrophila CBS 6074 TaxID=1295534 RepID=A0AAX4K2L2_9TREE
MAYQFDTPDRVLKRMQLHEEMELPSLPSFQHDDIDYDSMGAEPSNDQHEQLHQYSAEVEDSQTDMATPHPLRKATGPPASSTITGGTRSTTDSFSTASGSPFPPIEHSPKEGTPSPYAPTTALTSTPQSHQARSISHSLRTSTLDYTTTATSRTSRHERTRSGTGSLGNSTHASRNQRWQTPGEMSGSFSGDEIVEGLRLGAEQSIPLNDESDRHYHDSHSQSLPELPSLSAPPEETPITRRLSSGHVLLERRKKRGTSTNLHQLEPLDEISSNPTTPSTPNMAASTDSAVTALPNQPQDRIPSLSRSEVSGTDVSEAASTPEGPVRNVSMVTPRPDAHQEYEITGEYQYDIESADGDHSENPTWEYNQEYEYTGQEDEGTPAGPPQYLSPHKTINTYSAAKSAINSSMAHFSTPGVVRGQPFRENSFDSSAPTTVLQDVTSSIQNTPSGPVTPSPAGYMSKTNDVATPRAPLDDAERRKSHILAVLGSSSGPPSRTLRPQIRGTPHPLRRVSTAPDTESIAEEGSSLEKSQRSLRRAITPGMNSRLTMDQSADQSFVSVASSADLTSDKRASHMHSRISRGNTSFPTILLPTNPSIPGGGSLKGLSDQRADGIKIQKHLNAMNKQLLETNAELAREAEAWRDESDRLRGILEEHGIDVEDVDVLGGLNAASTSANMSQQLPDWPSNSPNGRNSTKGDHSELISQLSALKGHNGNLILNKASTSAQDLLEGLSPEEYAAVMQEMAEKLESLEEALNEKDQLIDDLKGQLEIAKRSGSPEQNELLDQIDRLSAQLEEAEHARLSLHAEFSAKTEQHAARFGEICSGFEDQVKGLERDLTVAKAETEHLKSDKTRLEILVSTHDSNGKEQELRDQLNDLEAELQEISAESQKRLTEVENLKAHSANMLEEKEGLMRRVEVAENEIAQLQARIAELEEMEVKGGSEDIEAMKDELRTACEARTAAEDQLARLRSEMEAVEQTVADQENDLNQQRDQIDEFNRVIETLEADLAMAQDSSRVNEQAEEELRHVQQELQQVNDVLEERESEVEMLKGKLEVANIATQALRTSQRRSTSPASTTTPTSKTPGIYDTTSNQDSFVAAMEERLDEAYREIGRLKHELNATPHRKSAVEVRDARIQALEREKAALTDRLASGKNVSMYASPAPSGVQDAGSPFKRPTPLLHRTIASLRTPKTPGPMKDLSWLQTTIGDANEPVLQAQLEYLQNELQDANNQLDHNFSRLESAGLGAVALAEKLAAAEERIGELEDEIRTLVQRNKASLALVSAQREERERDNEGRMQKALEAVHNQMEELKSDIANERARIQRDNGRLQNHVSEMKLKSQAEIESFQSEMARMAETAENDLKATQDDLGRVIKERDELRKEIQSYKTQIAHLERDVAKEQRAYESLSRRNAQSTESAAFQAELAQKNQTINSLQNNLRQAETELDRLQETLSQRTRSMDESQSRLAKYQKERETVFRELEEFEKDLQKQRAESKQFGVQLHALKNEQNNTAEKHQVELKALERELKEAKEIEKYTSRQLDDVQKKSDQLESWKSNHECENGLSQAMIDQKQHFKTQSRNLATQIKYLKAKFTRESTFRNSLSLQKRYLLLLIGGMSLDQQSTLKMISQMAYPDGQEPELSIAGKPKKSFKSVGIAVLGLIRAKNLANDWKLKKELKSSITQTTSSGERRRVSART